MAAPTDFLARRIMPSRRRRLRPEYTPMPPLTRWSWPSSSPCTRSYTEPCEHVHHRRRLRTTGVSEREVLTQGGPSSAPRTRGVFSAIATSTSTRASASTSARRRSRTRSWTRAARLRRRMNNELNFPPNFERLVLGCIDADFCK